METGFQPTSDSSSVLASRLRFREGGDQGKGVRRDQGEGG